MIFIGRINYKYYMEDLFMSKYYSINKFSKILGVSAQTLRNGNKKGKLHPHHTSSNGYRYYSHEQLNQVMNVKPNLDRKELMKRISQNKVDKVVVFYKDRLLRFGFELVEYIASLYDCNIEIIDHTEKTEQQELVEDLVQIITVFSCKLQGKRANKARKLVKELIDDGGEEDETFTELLEKDEKYEFLQKSENYSNRNSVYVRKYVEIRLKEQSNLDT